MSPRTWRSSCWAFFAWPAHVRRCARSRPARRARRRAHVRRRPRPASTPPSSTRSTRPARKATFFVIGRKAEAHPDLVREIIRGATRSACTRTRTTASSRCARARVTQGPRARDRGPRVDHGRTAGALPPPIGHTNPIIARVADELGLTIVGWSVSANDGSEGASADGVLARVRRGLRDGAIVLLHDAAERGRTGPGGGASARRARVLEAVHVVPASCGRLSSFRDQSARGGPGRTARPPCKPRRAPIVPPADSTRPRHTASPRPVPAPTSFVVTKGSNRRSRIAAAMPGPVSSTSMRTRLLPRRRARGRRAGSRLPGASGDRRSRVHDEVQQHLGETLRRQRDGRHRVLCLERRVDRLNVFCVPRARRRPRRRRATEAGATGMAIGQGPRAARSRADRGEQRGCAPSRASSAPGSRAASRAAGRRRGRGLPCP